MVECIGEGIREGVGEGMGEEILSSKVWEIMK